MTVASVFESIIGPTREFLTAQIPQLNALVQRLQNADSTLKLVCEYRDSAETEDPMILAFRKFREDQLAALAAAEEKVEAHIVEAGLVDVTPVDVDAVTAEAKDIKSQIDGMLGALKAIPGGTEVIAALPEIAKIPGTRKSAGTSTGDIRRPRLSSITVDGENISETVNGKVVSSMGVLMKHLRKLNYFTATGEEITTSFLQDHLYSAAGEVKDLKARNGRPIGFSLALKQVVDGKLAEDGSGDVTVYVVAVPTA